MTTSKPFSSHHQSDYWPFSRSFMSNSSTITEPSLPWHSHQPSNRTVPVLQRPSLHTGDGATVLGCKCSGMVGDVPRATHICEWRIEKTPFQGRLENYRWPSDLISLCSKMIWQKDGKSPHSQKDIKAFLTKRHDGSCHRKDPMSPLKKGSMQ